MANVNPFRALHYNPKMIKDISEVIVPPYDVIAKGDEQKYFSRSPYNFAHLILPRKEDDDYSHAAELLKKWRDVGVFTRDPVPSYFLYEQTFTVDKKTYHRKTLMATVQLTPFSEGIVRPHENTHGKHKKDRLQILTTTGCNFSHVFGMVKDPEGYLETCYERWRYHAPFLKGTDDSGVVHTLWREDGSKEAGLTAFFKDKSIYIVDGHHRYESALMYARQADALGNASDPAAHMLFAIANVYDPSLVVFPTHRKVNQFDPTTLKRGSVEAHYDLETTTVDAMRSFVKKPHREPKFGLFAWGELFFCTPKRWHSAGKTLGQAVSRLSVTWSDDKFLKDFCKIEEQERSSKITYEKSLDVLWEGKSSHDLMIFHAPPAIEDITAVADESGYMPQKSTYFYPKLAAGLTLREVKTPSPAVVKEKSEPTVVAEQEEDTAS
jgi:uncharacterized protein (DUF1015 family)